MSRALQPPANQATVPINTGSESEHIAARAAVTGVGDISRSTRRRARARHGVFGMMSKDWIENMITARLAEYDARSSYVAPAKRRPRGGGTSWRSPGARHRGAGPTPRAEEQALWRPNEGRGSHVVARGSARAGAVQTMEA